MKSYLINLPSGIHRLILGCPTFLPDDCPTVALMPDSLSDFSARLSSCGYLDAQAILSIFLGKYRGLPRDAITVRIGREVVDLPKLDTGSDVLNIKLPKCKQIYTIPTKLFGSREDVYSVFDTSRTHLIFGTAPISREALSRLRILTGTPPADRAVFCTVDGVMARSTLTDSNITSDAVTPVAHLVHQKYGLSDFIVSFGEISYKVVSDNGTLALSYPISACSPEE